MNRFAISTLAAAALAGCTGASLNPSVTQVESVDTSRMPEAGIFAVSDVIVTDQGGDTLRFAAASTGKFTFAELSAVVWCRARQEAIARKYDGWYQDAIQQISNGPDQPLTAIATAHYFKGKAPPGKKTLKHEKDVCKEAPAAARPKA